MEETKSSEFYGKELVNPNSTTWFSSFDRFKGLVLRFAERDEEIKYYIRDRKNRYDAIHANISYSNVDRVLCMLFNNLGYDEIVNAYENIEKWYA